MKDKNLVILKFLGSQDDWVTSFSMSSLLNISVRSIKNYIHNINHNIPDLIASSREGFMITDKKRLTQILTENKSTYVPQNSEDRKNYVLRKLLLESKKIALDKLVDDLFISHATLNNELARLKSDLVTFDLVLKTKNNLVFIEGSADNKKKLISKLIYDDSQNSFLSIKLMQEYLQGYDLMQLKNIVLTSLREHKYFMDDFSLLSLVMHIAITMERKNISGIASNDLPIDWEHLIDNHIREIIKSIIEQIYIEFAINFSSNEIYHFALLIMTRAISDSINDVNMNQLGEFVGDDIVALVSLMQEKVKETYNISIINKDFTIRFSLHLKNLLMRLEHKLILKNPQMLYIKNAYPFIYDVSVFLANIIKEEKGYLLSEDEISYFTLHLGALIEERKVIKHDVRAVLVNPQYFSKSTSIADKLSIVFEDNLLITGIVSEYGELETYSNYDMIITTIPYEPFFNKPIVRISTYFAYKDILAISKKIEEVLKERIKTKVESRLKFIFKEELFFVDPKMRNQNDVINSLADALNAHEYVDDSFKKKMFERELVSSSAYANIAMPHPLEMCARHSAIAVSIHPNPIIWNDSKVNIVFMIAINAHDSLFFKDIFDFITEVLSEDKKLKSILELDTYDDFIAKLVSFAK